MANFFDVPIEKIREFEQAGNIYASINTISVSTDETNGHRMYTPSIKEKNHAEDEAKQVLSSILKEEISELSDIEANVIRRRFSINPEEDYDKAETLTDIARTYNLSRERIRQIQNVALQKLQKALEKNVERDLLEDMIR